MSTPETTVLHTSSPLAGVWQPVGSRALGSLYVVFFLWSWFLCTQSLFFFAVMNQWLTNQWVFCSFMLI